MGHHSPPLNRPQLPSKPGVPVQPRSDTHPSEFPQLHGPDSAINPAPTATGGQRLDVEISNHQQQQQDALPETSAADYPADVPGELVPSFSRRLRPAPDDLSSQALTPVMVPHAQARIQAQHDTTTTTPSAAIVKDTPQSAAAATPWSRVKDTPSNSEVTPLQRGCLPHGFWLGLDQPFSSKLPLSAPVQSSMRAASSTLQQQHVSDAAAAAGGDRLYPGGRPQEQFHASPPAPELTLRLSLSDGSSTKSNKAGQPTPSRGVHHPLQQHATPPMQPRLTIPPHPQVSPAAAKGAAWSEVPQQHSLHASQAGHTFQAGGQLQDQQPLGQQPPGQQLWLPHPAVATDSSCQSQAPAGDNPPPLLAAPVAAMAPTSAPAAAVAPTLADSSHPVSPRVSSRSGAQGRLQQPPHEHAPTHGHVMDADAEHEFSAVSGAEGSGRGGSNSEAAGCDDPSSADQHVDQPNDDVPIHSPEPDHDSLHGASGDGPAPAGSDPEGDAPDDPDSKGDAPDDPDPNGASPDDPDPDRDTPDDPDPDPGDPDLDSSEAAELVPHRYKQRAPTQVTHACRSCILHGQAAVSSKVNGTDQSAARYSTGAALHCL